MADERPDFTERPWAENAWPTAEQFRDWYLKQSPDAQLYLAERTLADAQRADRCILMDHEAQIERLPHVLTAARAQALREAADGLAGPQVGPYFGSPTRWSTLERRDNEWRAVLRARAAAIGGDR